MGNNEILNNVADIIMHNDDINLMIHKVCCAFAETGVADAAQILTGGANFSSENFSDSGISRSFSANTPLDYDFTLSLYYSSNNAFFSVDFFFFD